MGIESISQSTLQGMHKGFNRSDSYVPLIESLNRRNISYSFNFVFGTDADDARTSSTARWSSSRSTRCRRPIST